MTDQVETVNDASVAERLEREATTYGFHLLFDDGCRMMATLKEMPDLMRGLVIAESTAAFLRPFGHDELAEDIKARIVAAFKERDGNRYDDDGDPILPRREPRRRRDLDDDIPF